MCGSSDKLDIDVLVYVQHVCANIVSGTCASAGICVEHKKDQAMCHTKDLGHFPYQSAYREII